MKNSSSAFSARDVAECALFVALMVAAAYIKIPFPLVPLTFQTVVAVLAGLLLGWKKGMVSVAAYAVTGLMGIPVFASGDAGIFYVLKPSFGYILGFIASAGVAGIGYRKDKNLRRNVLVALAAFIVDYVFGIAYFIAVWTISGYEGLWSAVAGYNLIYMPKDAVFCALAGVLAGVILPAVKKREKKCHGGENTRSADR